MKPNLTHPEDQMTREGLIARLYNAYSAGIETKDAALDLIAEIAQAVDGDRKRTTEKTKNSKFLPMRPPTNLPKSV